MLEMRPTDLALNSVTALLSKKSLLTQNYLQILRKISWLRYQHFLICRKQKENAIFLEHSVVRGGVRTQIIDFDGLVVFVDFPHRNNVTAA